MRTPRFERLTTGAGLCFALGVLGAGCGDDAGATPTTDADAATADGATDAGGDAGAEASTSSTFDLGPGPFAIVYAGTQVGIDARVASATTFEVDKLKAFIVPTPASAPEAGTNPIVDTGGDGPIAWGRWAGGTTAGTFGSGSVPLTFTANGGMHYVVGKPAAALPPSGTATYALIGKTPVTVSDGTLAPGVASGSLAIAFAGASTAVGVSLSLNLPGDFTYAVESSGGSANPATSSMIATPATGATPGNFFSAANPPITVSGGAACTGQATCTASINGFIAGANAERVGLVVHIYRGAGGQPKSVSTALAFAKQ